MERRPTAGYGERFVFTLFTNDLGLAAAADLAGVDRIGLDLEKIGKAERQSGCSLRLNDHQPADLPAIGQSLQQAKLFCRTNSPHPGLRREVETLVAYGVQVLMLPFFTTREQAERFIDYVAGRALVCLLVESIQAATILPALVRLDGVDEIHVGLNDLQLSSTGACNGRWELLGSDLLERMADTVLSAGLPFRLGGLGRSRDNNLPIPSDLLYAQWPRLGAQGALLSQYFIGDEWSQLDLKAEVRAARQRLDHFASLDEHDMQEAKAALRWWTTHVASP
jgi:hypothetical protein